MSAVQRRMAAQALLGFLLGRAVLLGGAPAGASYFAAGVMQGGNVWLLAASVGGGVLSALPSQAALRYGVAMLGMGIAGDLFQKNGMQMRLWHGSVLMAVTLLALSATQYMLLPYQWKDLVCAAAEPVLVIALSRVFYEGVHWLCGQDVHGGAYRQMDQEELLSLLLMGMLALYGLPELVVSEISVTQVIVCALIPWAGYQYGIGSGAVAGALGGLLFVLLGQDSRMVGSLCLMGTASAVFRTRGKRWSVLAYLVSALLIGLTLYQALLEQGIWKSVLVGGLLWGVIPEKLLRRIPLPFPLRGTVTNQYSQQQLQQRLESFSESFLQLARVLQKRGKEKQGIERADMRALMQEMSGRVCGQCSHRESCMGQVAVNRPEVVSHLWEMQEQGVLGIEQMPTEFVRECIHPDWFLMETNQGLRMARAKMGFQNQLAQSRHVLAGQMEQVGRLFRELAGDLGKLREVPEEMEQMIRREMGNMRVCVRDIVISRNPCNRLEIRMRMYTGRGRLVTAREAAAGLTELFGKPFLPSRDSHTVIPRNETDMAFVEDTPLFAVTGVARRVKDGERVSGDTFSCLSLANGELLLALSDGMGSGEGALEESQAVIELLEQMTEAGFSRTCALKLVNSLYMPEARETGFATADLVVLNLYEGHCQFMKNGAAATWLCRGERMQRIEGQALPVGIVQEAAPYMQKIEIYSGDYVIMMTDGVVDAFSGREDALEELLRRKRIVNPQELAEYIVEEAVDQCDGCVRDDMSVVVAGIWKKTREHAGAPAYKSRQVKLS